VYLALGSNIGNRHEAMRQAIALIGTQIGSVLRTSSLIETEPWGFSSPHAFLNACVCVVTELTPRQLLEKTQQIERLMGRTEKSVDGHYHDRTIDIDILLYDDWHVDEPDLRIPHPLMQQREFVMRPLKEILQQG